MAEADWSSLPSDLVRQVGDNLLATNDIDCYMDMRAVCHNWRSATDDPCRPGGAGADLLRFRPRRWVMLEEEPKDDGVDTRLFVNLTTGRFLRRSLPLLRDHNLVATSDGLLVLAQRELPLAIRVLNPFTGSMLRFATRMPCEQVVAAVTGSYPAVVFSLDARHGGKVYCADPTSALFGAQYFPRGTGRVASIVAHAGHVYMVDDYGLVVKSVGTVLHRYDGKVLVDTPEVVKCPWDPDDEIPIYKFFLVESAGELLLVRRDYSSWRGLKVFRVDVELGALVPVKSIGSHALFLGYRCVSVDADKFPSVEGDSLYYTDGLELFSMRNIYRLDLRSGSEVNISSLWETQTDSGRISPFSFVQALLNYCVTLPDVQTPLRRILSPFFRIAGVATVVWSWWKRRNAACFPLRSYQCYYSISSMDEYLGGMIYKYKDDAVCNAKEQGCCHM